MPEFDEYGNYEINEDDYEPIQMDDKWVLIEEVRHFQNILKEFMEHPVTSEKEIRKREMLNDLKEYQKRLDFGKFNWYCIGHINQTNQFFFQRKNIRW